MAERLEIPNQQEWWDGKHVRNQYPDSRGPVSEFGRQVVERFPANSTVLELGCGTGDDALYFADRGHWVAATDFSHAVIDRNRNLGPVPGVAFGQLDLATALSGFESETYGVVYSHLALHYFDDAKTREIFDEIHRILEPGGVLAFACKSTSDMRYGKGERVGPDTFVAKGHIRHFFSEDYVRGLLEGYHITELRETEQMYVDDPSHLLYCFAVKDAPNVH